MAMAGGIRRGQARGAPRGLTWRELAGTMGCPVSGSGDDGRRQAGSGRARNRAKARLNWFSQGQRWGRCKVRRRAERVSRPAREKKRRLRVLVVTSCSPRPMRAVQRARLWAITWTASQAALAAKRQGCGICVPWASWRIPAWADSHNEPCANRRGYQQGSSTLLSAVWYPAMAGVVISLRMEFVNGMSASFAGQCFDLCRVGVQTLAFK